MDFDPMVLEHFTFDHVGPKIAISSYIVIELTVI